MANQGDCSIPSLHVLVEQDAYYILLLLTFTKSDLTEMKQCRWIVFAVFCTQTETPTHGPIM
jgi:hypothetical protein